MCIRDRTQITGILSPPKRAYAHFRRYENRLGNIFGAPAGTEELASLRKRCLSDGENLVEPAGPLFIAGTSVERLRKQERCV